MSRDLTDVEYLRDLAERLRHIPVMYGTDDGDIDRLLEIARALENFNNPTE
jgi:hypothetical protein